MFLLLDSETGGLTHQHSILTTYMAVYDANLRLIDELSLKIQPDNGILVTDPEALKVNGINPEEHVKTAISETKAAGIIADFLSQNSTDGKNKLMPFGHNVEFDMAFIRARLINDKEMSKFFIKYNLDTIVLGTFLKLIGKLPKDLPNSLGSYAEYFGILTPGLHDAKIDCQTTLSVLKKMIRLIKEGNIG